MKAKHVIFILTAIIILIGIIIWAPKGGSAKLNKPQSVAFDPASGLFLISNVGSGSIVAMDNEGKFSDFMRKAFEAPKGLLERGGLLYVTDPTRIHVVDISQASIIESYQIEGAIGLHDIAMSDIPTSGEELLYITDTAANCIWVYDPEAEVQEKIISPLLDKPSGIVYDRPRAQMLVVNNSKHSPILKVSARDRSVNIFMDTLYSDLDGIAIDGLGRIFFSSWREEMIIQIPQEQNRTIADLKGYKGAADIYYHKPGNELIVPLLPSNRIERIPLD